MEIQNKIKRSKKRNMEFKIDIKKKNSKISMNKALVSAIHETNESPPNFIFTIKSKDGKIYYLQKIK
ncbi:hypothetical protein M0811_02054 [Anaeramoeba ignava]|uniref:Uncharacterized protein n=1 Tax=Anaeramoeba ignava TaxID=1746090 RepID=A0A9Q0LBS6_ANAIG|nr:hypothetical protein M0811_02054 [Anaeramoeba ignava]